MQTRVLALALIFVMAAIGAYLYYGKPKQACEYRSFPIFEDDTVLPPARVAPEGFTRYRNEQYQFSIFYPSDLYEQEFPEAGGARTIVFQNSETLKGLQIFIVPYQNSGIVPRRMALDVAGSVSNVATTSVDGICARSFETHDPLLTDTDEIWIPNNGYLFEVTVYKGQENLLDQVIGSWRFL